MDVLIELYLYRALAFDKLGQRQAVLSNLREALRIAEGTQFRRLFYDLGDGVMMLLRRNRSSLEPSNFLGVLLKDSAPAAPISQAALIEPLSERELVVLRYLRTNLTTPEIANELVITVNTVRTHIKNIYQKLGVHKRSAAVRLARERNLFSTL